MTRWWESAGKLREFHVGRGGTCGCAGLQAKNYSGVWHPESHYPLPRKRVNPSGKSGYYKRRAVGPQPRRPSGRVGRPDKFRPNSAPTIAQENAYQVLVDFQMGQVLRR
jgi:hypothetical protein